MKERFKKILKRVDNSVFVCYVKETKAHWWNKWKTVMDGAAPLLFYKLPEGIRAVNELPSFKYLLTTDKLALSLAGIAPPPPPRCNKLQRGDIEIRESMMDMVRNADEIYVGILQDGKYYVATDTKSIQSCQDLRTLEFDED